MSRGIKFRHQHVTEVPAGYKVRTFHAGKHKLRIAFPKGARKHAHGQLISILHPTAEKNPSCGGNLELASTEIAGLRIPIGVVGNGFGPGVEAALESTAARNPGTWRDYWESFKAKISSLIDKAKDHDAEQNPLFGRKTRSSRKVVGEARLVTRHGGLFGLSSGKEYWEYEIGGRTYQVKVGRGVKKIPVKPWVIDAATGAVSNPRDGKLDFKARRNEFVKDSAGKHWMIQARESQGVWTAEAYPVTKKKVGSIAATARGDSESGAIDALLGKIERNPKAKRNLDEIDQAIVLAGKFKGSPATQVIESSVSLEKHRDDFAHLGWLHHLVFHPAYDHAKLVPKDVAQFFHDTYENDRNVKTLTQAWEKTAKQFNTVFLVFDFTGDEVELVATAKGEQLEFLGGNQAPFAGQLGVFRIRGHHDRDDLGDLVSLTYFAKKDQFGDQKQKPYYHIMGEDGGSFPRAYFDQLNKRIVITGGSYHLNEAAMGIIN